MFTKDCSQIVSIVIVLYIFVLCDLNFLCYTYLFDERGYDEKMSRFLSNVRKISVLGLCSKDHTLNSRYHIKGQ